ncbi:hypothetical protein [Deinococcus sedimenti]|uniref:Integral membrane protein n=1 Tax=Deinococcus sedimenti TaxID=1867090 RepID=A0ABQ2SAD7_9DEIO|nr:hypothetical protein [Deinococcus sedimenti]GGS02259.1 hypothetical protein GCM10008960_31160 [Deinococcus sedimenti]
MTGELRSLLSPRLQPPRTVTKWLDIATDGLTLEAARRVRHDYLNHFQDTLADQPHLTATDILRRWGSAHTANRELRRTHLTIRDAHRLPPRHLSLGGSLWSASAPVAGLTIAALPDLRRGEAVTPLLLYVGALTTLALLRWWILSRPLTPTRRATAYWLTSPFSGALLAGLMAALWFLHTGTLTPDPLLTWTREPASWAVLSVVTLHLWRLPLAVNASRKLGAETA